MCSAKGRVRFTPESRRRARVNEMSAKYQKQTHALRQFAALFNHLVGRHLHNQRHSDAERLRGLEIDDEFEFGWL